MSLRGRVKGIKIYKHYQLIISDFDEILYPRTYLHDGCMFTIVCKITVECRFPVATID